MTKKEFEKLWKSGYLILDGATGTNLQKKGMPPGICPEEWILANQEVILALQEQYIEAGTQIIYSPTFSGNRVKLEEFGLESELSRINVELVALSKKAAAGRAYVAGDITMTGKQLYPMGNMDFDELVEIYKEQATELLRGGVDLFVIETMIGLQETRAAVLAIHEVCDFPIMATLTFEKNGRTLYGTDPKTAAVVLTSLGVNAIGINCGCGPSDMVPMIEEMYEYTNLPLIAKPNAGMPLLNSQGETVYSMDPDEFAQQMILLGEKGARILGGCCGTTPEYIRTLVQAVANKEPKQIGNEKKRMVASERMTFSWKEEDPFFIIGERINPTGKKMLQKELFAGELDMVLSFASAQEEAGAKLLDVNLGLGGIDEKQMMIKAIDEIGVVTNLPLVIDTSDVAVMEAALRRYPGRALVNSISLEEHKMRELLPIVARYGAMFILLPLSDQGLPKSQAEKIAIIEEIAERAYSYGISKEDIVVDALINTVAANKRAAMEALETIRYCKQKGYSTVCGLSNISFGLPQRTYVNAAFLTMAIYEGLTMAIANPSQVLLTSTGYATDVLLGKEGADVAYIQAMEQLPVDKQQGVAPSPHTAIKEEARKASSSQPASVSVQESLALPCQMLFDGVLKGNRKGIVAMTQECLAMNLKPEELIKGALMPAIEEVGRLFESGRYFLPQLIASAETMQLAIALLEPLLEVGQDTASKGKVVIATVKGDIHDIGKNLVALMMKNNGFEVIDLGKDVLAETIVNVAIKQRADIIALSALMTTTMVQMKEVIAVAKQKGCKAKIMIGGAVVTEEYALSIGADGYSRDAAQAVAVAQEIVNTK